MDYLEKLSVLTTVPLVNLEKLNDVIDSVHSDDVVTQILEGKEYYELGTMEGTIYIRVENDIVKYKFIPNEKFDEIVKSSILNKRSKLIDTSLDRLKRSLVSTYKDIF